MFLAQKNSERTMIAWRPSATIETLKKRAALLKKIRHFFELRGVLEVETPLLCHTSVTDPHIESLTVNRRGLPPYYLQTSPEYAMKRLLAAESGDIFQLTKAFREDEAGPNHNPEFTMLEWYRLGFTHHDLMNEMDDFLQAVIDAPPAKRLTYTALFKQYFSIDPHTASVETLQHLASLHGVQVVNATSLDRDTWLQLLLSHVIEPVFANDAPVFLYDFPITQAALSRIIRGNPPTASRFEVYFRGMELANGFHELQDAHEQRLRFEQNLEDRRTLARPPVPLDDHFLTALAHGLPDCAGVALGVDRLIMLATNAPHIRDVLSFDITRA